MARAASRDVVVLGIAAQGEAGGDRAPAVLAAGAGAARQDRAAGPRSAGRTRGSPPSWAARRARCGPGGTGSPAAACRPCPTGPAAAGPRCTGRRSGWRSWRPPPRSRLRDHGMDPRADRRPAGRYGHLRPPRLGRSWPAWSSAPHRVRGWLNRRDDEQFWAQAAAVCDIYLRPPPGTVVICIDEKTGIQAKHRKYPERPARPRPAGPP